MILQAVIRRTAFNHFYDQWIIAPRTITIVIHGVFAIGPFFSKRWLCAEGLEEKGADRGNARFRHRKRQGAKEMRRGKDTDGLKEIRQESKKTDTGSDGGNQTGWDQTGYCRETGWPALWGGFHLLRSYAKDISSACTCMSRSVRERLCVSMDVSYLVWMCTPSCLRSDVCLSLLVGVSQYLCK